MVQRGDASGRTACRRPPIYKDLILLQLAALVFLIDQFTKFLVRELLVFRHSFPDEGFFRITHTYNTGSAFGLFQDQNFPLMLVSVAGITILVLIYRSQRQPTNLLRLALGLQLGGAAGNLLDRLRLGFVTDFLDVGAWPVFNLADASIVTGLVLLALMFLKFDGHLEREDAAQGAPEPGARDAGDGAPDAYAQCPVCDGDMETVPRGWRCSSCGVEETIEPGGGDSTPSEATAAGPMGPPNGRSL